jgi:hypothetical protein
VQSNLKFRIHLVVRAFYSDAFQIACNLGTRAFDVLVDNQKYTPLKNIELTVRVKCKFPTPVGVSEQSMCFYRCHGGLKANEFIMSASAYYKRPVSCRLQLTYS